MHWRTAFGVARHESLAIEPRAEGLAFRHLYEGRERERQPRGRVEGKHQGAEVRVPLEDLVGLHRERARDLCEGEEVEVEAGMQGTRKGGQGFNIEARQTALEACVWVLGPCAMLSSSGAKAERGHTVA